MFRRISAFLKLQPSEVAITSMMFLYIFGVLTFYYILKPIRAGLFLQNFPSSDLPYAYMLTALFAGTIATLVFRFGQRVSLLSLMTVTNLGIIATLIYFRWAMTREVGFLPYAYFVYVQIVSVLATTQFWLLAGRVYDSRQAKRTYGLLGAGAISGAMAGSLVPGFLSDRLSTDSMLLICIAICIGLILLSHAAWNHRRQTSVRRRDERKRDASRDRLGGLCRMVSGSRHLRLMAALIMLTLVGSQLAEWQLNDAVQTYYSGLEPVEQGRQINEFFGRFYLVTNVLGIVLQVFATGFVVRHLGILAGVLLLPAGLFAGALGVVLLPGLVMATVARGNDAALRYSMNRTSMELLYLPLSPTIRERLKIFVDVFLDRLGRALAGVLILVLTSAYLPFGLRGTALMIMVVTATSIVIAFAVRRTYVNEFRRQLERSEVDLSQITNFVTDPASVQMLVDALGSPEERRIRYALKLLQSTKGVDFAAELLPLLSHPSPIVRCEAARTLPALDDDLVETAERLLSDTAAQVRFASLDYLLTRSQQTGLDRLHEMLRHADERIRVAAASWAAEHAPPDFNASTEVVESLLARSVASRIAGAELASRLPEPEAVRVVTGLLTAAEPQVAGMAARTAASLGKLDLVDEIVPMIAIPALRKDIKAALCAFGPPVAERLGAILGEERADAALRREMPWVLARIGGASSARLLVAGLGAEDRILRYRVVKALNHLHNSDPSLPQPSPAIAEQVHRETRHYYEAVVVARALDDNPDGLLARALRERLDQDLELIFRLIGLQYPQKDIHDAYAALRSSRPDRRTAAIEFMDNVLRADLKSIILPLLEEASSEHLIDRAALQFGIQVDNTEDSLRLILEQPDSWLKSCALYEIGSRGLIQLADVCRRLARESDEMVRETAQWTLGRLEWGPAGAGG